jgi:hypothetical protein
MMAARSDGDDDDDVARFSCVPERFQSWSMMHATFKGSISTNKYRKCDSKAVVRRSLLIVKRVFHSCFGLEAPGELTVYFLKSSRAPTRHCFNF